MRMFNWPLNQDCLNIIDKIKIGAKILNPNFRFTQGDIVECFEKNIAEKCNVNHAVFVSSGSSANAVLAMYLKDNGFKAGDKICFPSTTWITSISPFIREGFEPVFCDVSPLDYCMNLDVLEAVLKRDNSIKCAFITSLLGFYPNIERLQEIQDKYKITIMLDNCESSFSTYKGRNISSFFTSTTSTYFGHLLQSVEGGFIFTNDDDINDYSKMCRNHGMIRSLNDKDKLDNLKNPLVDENFDFNILGSNFRNSNLNAYIGLLNLQKIDKHNQIRKNLYEIFDNALNDNFVKPEFRKGDHVPFCLPIVPKDKTKKDKIKSFLKLRNIEFRPIISGNILRQTPFKTFGDYKSFAVSEFLNDNGIYIGLNPFIEKSQISELINIINKI